MQGGGMPPVYGFGMMPSYGGFPPQHGYGNSQFVQSINGRPVGQPIMHGTVRPSCSTAAVPASSGPSSTKAQGTGAQGVGRAKTPTPVAQPVNTAAQHPSHQGSAGKPGGQQAQSQCEAPASAGQRPATTSLKTPSNSSGLQGALPSAQGMSTNGVPAHAPRRGSASALAPTQQTQATPVASHMRGGNHGGRRHWPLELWVVRHGETIENHTRTIAGQNSSGLTERGREQAQLLSQRLENVKFAGIYISDLNRTKQTADAVLRTMGPGTPAFTDSRLREKAAGKYEGQKIGYIEQMTRASGQAHRVFRPPGGESWEDVALRSRSFMREVLHRYCTSADQQGRPLSHRSYDSSGRTTPISVGYTPGSINAPGEPKRVLIVTHGGFISEFLSSAVGGVPNCAKNCSIFVLACARDHPQARAQFFLKTINDVSHLEPLLAKGVELPGPETVTETAADQLPIDDDEDDDKKLDDVQSNSSTIRTAATDQDEPPMLTAPESVIPISLGSHEVAPTSMAEVGAREQEAQGIAAAMEKRVRGLSVNTPTAQNGHLAAPRSPSIHMRNAMNRDGPASPPNLTNSPGTGTSVEHVQC